MSVRPECERSERIEGRTATRASIRRFAPTQHKRFIVIAALAALAALAAPALAQDNIPRSPAQAEQEQRMFGPGFEQMQRQSPQLYPYPPSTSPAPQWSPQHGYGSPPASSIPAPQATPPRAIIPPETHLRRRPQVTPPAESPQPPSEEQPQNE